jgi:phage tail-like protein
VARSRLRDVLQSHLFWAFDASSSGVPIFNPLFGFSRISAPEITTELETFKDGTFLWNRSVVKGGSVGPVTFERAASMFDADFYDWIMFTLHGNKDFEDGGTLGKIGNAISGALGLGVSAPSPRRNLLIVQFTNINIGNLSIPNDPLLAAVAAVGIVEIGAIFGGLAAAGAGAVALGIGPFQFATRIPGRAWLLHNCLPTRYKAGSDFDAASSSISLQELEVQPEHIEEFSLGIKP